MHGSVSVLANCATLEPHLPHVLIENGDMTQEEYDEYLHGRSDFIKATKKDSSNERKVSAPPTSETRSGTTPFSKPIEFWGELHNSRVYKQQTLFLWVVCCYIIVVESAPVSSKIEHVSTSVQAVKLSLPDMCVQFVLYFTKLSDQTLHPFS